MRNACSTAADVSPPATTNVLTPRSASATASEPKAFSTRPAAADMAETLLHRLDLAGSPLE